jgi:hypothetical protein
MNPYFALSAIFLLGLRGIEKKLKLPCPPLSALTAEDKQSGQVRLHNERSLCSEDETDAGNLGEDVADHSGARYGEDDEAGEHRERGVWRRFRGPLWWDEGTRGEPLELGGHKLGRLVSPLPTNSLACS